jgi:hypothetical protein
VGRGIGVVVEVGLEVNVIDGVNVNI